MQAPVNENTKSERKGSKNPAVEDLDRALQMATIQIQINCKFVCPDGK